MNEKIKQLADQCREEYIVNEDGEDWSHVHFNEEKFAELIVRECVKECQQEWYDLNNAEYTEIDARSVAIRVGQKNGMLKAISRIKNHFGIKE